MAHFEKGSHVLLFLSCSVSWSKTTALLVFLQGWRKNEGLAEEWGGKLKESGLWGQGPQGAPLGLRDGAWNSAFLKPVDNLILI